MSVSECPVCHMRFALHTELEWHTREEHRKHLEHLVHHEPEPEPVLVPASTPPPPSEAVRRGGRHRAH